MAPRITTSAFRDVPVPQARDWALRMLAAAAALQLATACATPIESAPLGSIENPVRCDGKRGELAYLARLRCESGGAPQYHFKRRGPRGPHGSDTDEFELRCVYDDRSQRVYIDRHHPGHVDDEPLPGFAIVAETRPPRAPPAQRSNPIEMLRTPDARR